MSTIKDTLIELLEAAEEIAIPKEPTAAAPVIAGEGMHSDDFATAASSAPAQAPSMPQGQMGATTVQKTVLNKELVLAVTSELKSTIATYEKKFEKDDLSVEDASIYLNNMLESLAFHADKIAALINQPAAAVEAPAPTPMSTEGLPELVEPAAAPAPIEEMPPTEEGTPGPGLTNPGGEEEAPAFTNPSEAI